MKSLIRLGTRGSPLALYQTELVKTKILEDFPLVTIEIVKIKTSGDMIRREEPHPFETKRIFTREIEEALAKSEIDLAVHSAKDMAVPLPEGLKIGAVLEREDPRDCLISKDKKKVSEFPLGARIGTSSLRRKMQLLRMNPELIIEEVHGNVETRIRKVDEGNYDGVVLACAGIKRLGLLNRVSEIFPEDQFYPAPGQGIIAIESRERDHETDEILKVMNHPATFRRLECERAFLKRLEGGCQLPCGISTQIEGKWLRAAGAIFSIEDYEWAKSEVEASSENALEAGNKLAEAVLAKGGQAILEKIRKGKK